jgi:hypothetical protein
MAGRDESRPYEAGSRDQSEVCCDNGSGLIRDPDPDPTLTPGQVTQGFALGWYVSPLQGSGGGPPRP